MDLTNAVIGRYNAEIARLTAGKILAEAQLEVANQTIQELRETIGAAGVEGSPLASDGDTEPDNAPEA